MDHQDFKTIIFNSKAYKNSVKSKQESQKKISQKIINTNENETVKIEADKKLGVILSQARISKGYKSQNEFVTALNQKTNMNISSQIYNKWESNKDNPTNEQIAKMEKFLGTKLPRNKKVNVEN